MLVQELDLWQMKLFKSGTRVRFSSNTSYYASYIHTMVVVHHCAVNHCYIFPGKGVGVHIDNCSKCKRPINKKVFHFYGIGQMVEVYSKSMQLNRTYEKFKS